MKRFLNRTAPIIVLAFVAMVRLEAAGPDDLYVQIYGVILDADRLSANGQSDAARAKYLEAQTALKKMQTSYPNRNEKVVKFRLRYLEEKVGLGQQAPSVAPMPAEGRKSVEKPAPQGTRAAPSMDE